MTPTDLKVLDETPPRVAAPAGSFFCSVSSGLANVFAGHMMA
jgi:hypothetical protein